MSDPRPGQKRLTAILGFAFAVEGALYSAVTPILPLLTRKFALSDSAAGLLLSGYSAGSVAGSLLCVAVLRKVNARAVTVAGLIALATMTVLFAWGGNGVTLICARLAGGVAAGVLWTSCVTWLLSSWSDERRGAALGASMSYALVGTLAGPTVGTLAVQFGMRLPYMAVAGLCVVAAGWIATMPRPSEPHRTADAGASRPRRALTLALLSSGMVALAGGVIGLVNVAGPLVLTRRGATDLQSGLVFLAAAALCAVAGRWMGAVVDRWGARRPLIAGLLWLAVLLPVIASGLPAYVVASGVIALVLGTTFSYVATATMLTSAGEAAGWSLGFGTALVASVWGVGETVGAIYAGVGLDSVGAARTMVAAAALVALGLICFVATTGGRHTRRAGLVVASTSTESD